LLWLGKQLLLDGLLLLLLLGPLSHLGALADGEVVVGEPSAVPAVLELLLHDGSSSSEISAPQALAARPEELIASL